MNLLLGIKSKLFAYFKKQTKKICKISYFELTDLGLSLQFFLNISQQAKISGKKP